ncbi:long-chain-fatty-acid--CoA ligase [Salinisphaera sp. PC39]|uniref:long-chain-fatty-acid--CoA ligase n=1 Tax=Salinisphaera sp. PC39 TaxID=1304156 RepID=UPI00334087F2
MRIPLTPMDFARRARRLYGDREAVVDGDLRLTYSEFFDRCDRWSAKLQALGVRAGDRVAYIAPNTHAHLEGYYAVPQIGAVMVPINYRLSPEEFEYIIGHCGAKVVCAHADHIAAVDGIRDRLPEVEHFVALEGSGDGWLDYESLVAEAEPVFEAPEIDEDDLITINYTSGTTSRPKGVMMTHRSGWMNSVGTLAHEHLTPADRYLWTLPMFHVNGWTFVWTITACGGTHVCLRKVDPAEIFRLMEVEDISLFCAAPTVLISIANAPPELRAKAPRGIRLFTAGAPPAAATIERIEDELGWELTQAYGLTETAPFITICEPRPEHAELSASERAAIKARQGVELITSGDLRVVDDHGDEVPWDGETQGQITVRGNVVMKGYYNDPEATDKAIRDGYFHTGDAAVVHPDGYVEIRDRIKDVIISGGENISSVEVEAALLRHPAVQEAAVVGMPHPKWGESPHAFVIVREGEEATEEDLRSFLREHLAHFKTPQWFTFVDELPKTATGKIQKYVLRQGESAVSRQ